MLTRSLLAMFVLVALSAAAGRADEFGSRVPGQHVYDRAGVLSATDIQTLERKAAALDALGAPTVIFIQTKSASLEQAQQDARSLMDSWDVESSRGAHDGFVMLFDLTPGNTQHGQVGLFAGARHVSAALPSATLNYISGTVMRPSLASGNLAEGIGLGLDATAEDLRAPASTASDPDQPPPPAAAEPLPGAVFNWIGEHFLTIWVVFFGLSVVQALVRVVRRVGGRASGDSSSSGFWSSSGSSGFSGGSDSGSASSGGDSGGTSF
jgi:uncharacterized membrane protein YgcG